MVGHREAARRRRRRRRRCVASRPRGTSGRGEILTLGAGSPWQTAPALRGIGGYRRRRLVPAWGSWTCVMSVHILERAGGAELDGGDDAGDDEQHDRDGRGEADLGAAGTEGQAVRVADQDVGAARRRVVRGERPTLGEQEDRAEVVEVEREGRDQQRGDGDQQQREGDLAEVRRSRSRRRCDAASFRSDGIACSAPVQTRNM